MKRNAARAAARRAKAAESKKKKSPSSDDEGTSTAQTRRNSRAGKGKHDGTFAIDDTWVPDLSEATPTGAYHDLPPSTSDPGSSAGPSRLWTAQVWLHLWYISSNHCNANNALQMSYQHLMGQRNVSAPSQPYSGGISAVGMTVPHLGPGLFPVGAPSRTAMTSGAGQGDAARYAHMQYEQLMPYDWNFGEEHQA